MIDRSHNNDQSEQYGRDGIDPDLGEERCQAMPERVRQTFDGQQVGSCQIGQRRSHNAAEQTRSRTLQEQRNEDLAWAGTLIAQYGQCLGLTFDQDLRHNMEEKEQQSQNLKRNSQKREASHIEANV